MVRLHYNTRKAINGPIPENPDTFSGQELYFQRWCTFYPANQADFFRQLRTLLLSFQDQQNLNVLCINTAHLNNIPGTKRFWNFRETAVIVGVNGG